MKQQLTFLLSSLFMLLSVQAPCANAESVEPLIIGLNADLSGGSARGGKSVKRGALIAIQEINDEGGLLGRPLTLMEKNHRGIPARGLDNIHELATEKNLLAVLGGIHTPVALSELPVIHEHKILYLDPWAAGTPIVDNGYDPNFVFRISVRDEHAGTFLINEAVKRKFKKIGLFLEQTGWGRSNELAMTKALSTHGLKPALTEWFHWGKKDFKSSLRNARKMGIEVLLLVANAPESVALVESMAALEAEQRIPIISHWGLSAGTFYEDTRLELPHVDLSVLQTFSFYAPWDKTRSAQFLNAYREMFLPDTSQATPEIVAAPTGAAHAYDLIHLLAEATRKAQTTDSQVLRLALENLQNQKGLVRHYEQPFSATRHEGLDMSDYRLCRIGKNGAFIPVEGADAE